MLFGCTLFIILYGYLKERSSKTLITWNIICSLIVSLLVHYGYSIGNLMSTLSKTTVAITAFNVVINIIQECIGNTPFWGCSSVVLN